MVTGFGGTVIGIALREKPVTACILPPEPRGDRFILSLYRWRYVTAPITIPTSNTTRTYTSAKHSRIKRERIAASAYDDNRHKAISRGAAETTVEPYLTSFLKRKVVQIEGAAVGELGDTPRERSRSPRWPQRPR